MLAATTNYGFDRVDQKHRKTAKDDHSNDQPYPRVAMPSPPMWPEVLYQQEHSGEHSEKDPGHTRKIFRNASNGSRASEPSGRFGARE